MYSPLNATFRWTVFFLFLLGIFLGGAVGSWLSDSQRQRSALAKTFPQYRHTNPAINNDLPLEEHFSEDLALKKQFAAFIDAHIKDATITNASLYLRDLNRGTWVGINDNAEFSPGKLLKIPLMIAYYKLAESEPGILAQKITFTESGVAEPQLYKPSRLLTQGNIYSVQELMEYMIVDSNDDAANLLFDHINPNTLNEIFSDLGITFKEEKATQDLIPLKLYSLFFRVLYNATYLNREYSEKALELLIKADKSIGIGAQLPNSIVIANRYGARLIVKDNFPGQETYDCGIVYSPVNPYLLCAAVQGKDVKQLNAFLSNLGKLTYGAMNF